MGKIVLNPLASEERKYLAFQSGQITRQTGCLGLFTIEVEKGSHRSSWKDLYGDKVTPEFLEERDGIIDALCFGRDCAPAIFQDGNALFEFCCSHPEFRISEQNWGARIDTERHVYLFLLTPSRGSQHCFCYRKEWLQKHMLNASQGIRFIDPHYRDLFRIPDGDSVRIYRPNGNAEDCVARYIDESHVEIGDRLYHICEFAEHMAWQGNKVVPLRSSLPAFCYACDESSDKDAVAMIYKGEPGLFPTKIPIEKGVSAQKAVARLNDALGVSKVQAAAMYAGAMYGWEKRAADPANYNEDGVLRKNRNGGI